MTQQEIARAHAERGAQLLDEQVGPGWENRINLNKLDMESCRYCIVGQLYRNFTKSPLWNDSTNPIGFGFDKPFSYEPIQFDYADLDDAWIAIITERRAARESEQQAEISKAN